jgi:putative spermidine/putrescine transport system permease protein
MGLLLLIPGVVYYIAIFLLPTIALLRQGVVDEAGQLSAAWYGQFVHNPFYVGIFLRTLKLSLIATGIAFVLGYPCAAFLAQSRRGRNLMILAVLAPLLVSSVVRSYGWIVILGPNGLLDRIGGLLGGHHVDLLFSETAVTIGLAQVLLPFMVLPIAGSLQQIDGSLLRAASNLGAGPARVFWRVVLPLSLPGVAAGCVITFSLCASSFVTPSLLGGAKVPVMPYLIYEQGLLQLNWPFAAALATILLASTVVLSTLYTFALPGRSTDRALAQ